MYLKLNNNGKNLKRSRKKTTLIVLSIHIIILLIVFLIFTVDTLFKSKKLNSINVTIVNSAAHQQQISSQKIAGSRLKPKTVKKKQPLIKKKITRPKPKPKKTWKALDPSQIIKSTTKLKRNKKPQNKIEYKPMKASDIAAKLRSNLKSINFKSTNSVNPSLVNYYDKIKSYLGSMWEEPSRAALGSRNPAVLIHISVNSGGKVLSAKIVKKSDILVMDRSIMKLLSNLSTLPRPPKGAVDFEVNMVLED